MHTFKKENQVERLFVVFAIKNCLKNWDRIHKKGEANSILLDVHRMATKYNLPWPKLTKTTLETIGIEPKSETENIHKVALKKLKEKFYEDSFAEINSDHSKLPMLN